MFSIISAKLTAFWSFIAEKLEYLISEKYDLGVDFFGKMV